MLSGQGNELSLLCRLRRTVQYFRSVYAKLRNQVEFFFFSFTICPCAARYYLLPQIML